jgi:hypothetical protein
VPLSQPQSDSESGTLLSNTPLRQLYKAFSWAIDPSLFAHLKPHGNSRIEFHSFTLLILFWTWSDKQTLTQAFNHASNLCFQLLGCTPFGSFRGFLSALHTWTDVLIPILRDALQQRILSLDSKKTRIGDWFPLAVDGSRTKLPRTLANEISFNSKKYGKGATARSRKKWKNKKKRQRKVTPPAPQMWLTLVWQMPTRLIWTWLCGPSYSSERKHFQEIIDEQNFPEKTLFCGDAGFVGYDLWQSIIDKGHHFLIRVGANVRLLKNLAHTQMRGDLVYSWPNAAMKKKQPPILLRLLKLKVGKAEMFLVTNVLNPKALTPSMAVKLYKARWGVEVQFRTLKQTFGRNKLESRTPESAYTEMAWSLLGLWLVQLLTLCEQIPEGIEPDESSASVALQVFREVMSGYVNVNVSSRLKEALKDSYKRKGSKQARFQPKQKSRPKTGEPKILNADADQKKVFKALFPNG